jgi:glycosyltransferase involved in cell wall biosynthesis
MGTSVFYIQNRTHRAGAQTCLARILRNKTAKDWTPILVSSEKGWLTGETDRAGVATICERFPSSRSLRARLYGNRGFAHRVAEKAKSISWKNSIVHANDHLEGLLGLALAARFGAAKAIFLRSPGMTRDDYYKYRCNEYNLIVAVGDELQSRARSWDPDRVIQLIYDGIEVQEFATAKPKITQVPKRILVIGSPLQWKGWADLTEALYRLEREGSLPPLAFDFTGTRPGESENDLKLERLRIVKCNFLGRVEAFHELVRSYDLVINPTRMESFGMAAIEVLAAGVPLLSSRTGVIEQVQEREEMLFPPSQPAVLAAALRHLLENWNAIDFGIVRTQENIRSRFLIDHTMARLSVAYERLLAQRTRPIR